MRRISNLNKIRGLERKLSKKDEEMQKVYQENRVKDYKYREMKKKANSLQAQLNQFQYPSMYQQMPRTPTAPNMFTPIMLPKSMTLETIVVPDHILANPAS